MWDGAIGKVRYEQDLAKFRSTTILYYVIITDNVSHVTGKVQNLSPSRVHCQLPTAQEYFRPLWTNVHQGYNWGISIRSNLGGLSGWIHAQARTPLPPWLDLVAVVGWHKQGIFRL